MSTPRHNAVLPHTLYSQVANKLFGKRVVLASSSPRRAEILRTCGLRPEIVPSTFNENIQEGSFSDVYDYPLAIAEGKAIEVYERLLTEDPEDPPELVIGADTIVLTHIAPPISTTSATLLPPAQPDILLKPRSKADNLRMLLDLNGQACEVVTAVTLLYPVITSPGYEVKRLEERSLVYFYDNSDELLKAYVESGEGIDRAGGFAIQGLGSLLIRKVDGDYWNVVGFPAASFFRYLDKLVHDEQEFLEL